MANKKAKKLNKYVVTYKYEGWIDIDVKASNPDEAREKAEEIFATADLAEKGALIDSYPECCYLDTGDSFEIVKSY